MANGSESTQKGQAGPAPRGVGRWPAGQACYFAGSRTGCEGLAAVRRGTVPLCRSCSAQASSLAREQERPVLSRAQLLAAVARHERRLRDLARQRDLVVLAAVSGGATWADVGRTLGVTRQAARQRFGGPTPRL
jgi:hypothetical protein